MGIYIPLLLLATLLGAQAGPISSGQPICATTCKEAAKFNYETGKTYEYRYNAETTSLMQGSTDQTSGMYITADAQILVNAPCDMTLKLSGISLEELDPLTGRRLSDNAVDFARELEARPLHFSYQDGRVDSVCAEEDEAEWILNIKRGVISALQNGMDHLNADHIVTETDVGGRCEASYRVSRGLTSTTVSKSKDLLACTDRSDTLTAFRAAPYHAKSYIQSLPIVKSTHDCEQTITGGIISRSECQESHVLRPFSNQDSGAVANTKHSLEVISQRAGSYSDRINPTRRTTLLFNHEKEQESSTDRSAVDETLRTICGSSDVRPETPALFSKLISQLRELNEKTLRAVRKTVNQDNICESNHQAAKKFLHDALPMVGTSASVSVMTSAMSQGHLTATETDTWASSLAFISQPNLQMIRSAQRLVDMTNPSKTTLLSATSLVNAFCQTRDCEDHEDVAAIASTIAQKLGESCQYETAEEKEQILTSLKALGNLGVANGVSSALARCANSQNNDAEIRVAALDAYRRMPCNADSRTTAMTIFSSPAEDSEVRIAAYLAAMQCPSESRLNNIKTILASEEVNQVGSFVWTHLTNLQESQDSFKADIRAILEDAQLQKEFNLDARKFSRNYESSYFSPSLNTGAKAEGNLVWSQSSFVPRSANLNLTFDMFGNSVNLLEVGGRVEGIENLLETMFGPEGYFPDTAIADALSQAKKTSEDERMDQIRSQVPEPNTTPEGSIYMRMFGNELSHSRITANSLQAMQNPFNYLNALITLGEGGEIDLGKNIQFLDASITFPTAIGIPLKLAVNGSASMSLQAGGKFDIRQALSNPRNIDIDGYLKPSGAVELTGEMILDATMLRSGIKMTSILHSSVEANVLLKLKNGEVLTANVDMPRQKQEIVSLTSRVFLLAGDNHHEQMLITDGRVEEESCSGSTMSNIAGVRMCANLAYPNASLHDTAPFFPLTGPVTAGISLEKTDDFDAYVFEARFTKRENPTSLQTIHGRLGFNTPGSRVNREILLDFNLDPVQKSMSAEMRSPWKSASLTGSLSTEENDRQAALRLLIDGEETALTAHLTKEILASGVIYSPNVEVRIPGREPMTLQGQFTHKPASLVSAEMTLNNVFSEPIVVKGSFEQELSENSARIENLFEVRTPFTNVKGTSSITMNRGTTRGEADLMYSIAGRKERMSASMRLKRVNNKKTYRDNFSWEMTSSQFPEYNVALDADFKHIIGQMDTNVNLRYSGDLEATKNRLTMSHTGTYGVNEGTFTMNHAADFSFKPLRIAVDGKLNHMHNSHEVRTRGMLNYMNGQRASLDMEITRSDSPIGLNADISLTYPGRTLRFTDLLETVEGGKFRHEMMVQWQEGKSITSVTDVGKTDGRYELRSQLESTTILPTTVFTASIFPSLAAPDVSAKLQVSDVIYATGASYSYTHMEEFTWSIFADHPDYHVGTSGDLHVEDNTYTKAIEATWGPRSTEPTKVSFVSSVAYSANGFSGQAKIVYPGDKIAIALDHERQGEIITSNGQISWAKDQRIHIHHQCTVSHQGQQVSLSSEWQMDTSFAMLQSVSATLNYAQDPSMNNMDATLQWAEGKQVQLSLRHARPNGIMRTKTSFTVSTPFAAIRNFETVFNYNIMKIVPRMNLDVSLNEEKMIDINLAGSYSPTNSEVSFVMRTPVRYLDGIRFNSQMTWNGTPQDWVMTGSAVAQYMKRRVEADYSASDSGAVYNRRLVIRTPFTDDISMEKTSTIHEDGRITSSGTVQWAPEKSITGNVEIQGNVFSSNGLISVTVPSNNIVEQISLTWSHHLTSTSAKISTDLALNNEHHYKLNIAHSHSNMADINTRLNIQTPHTLLRTANIDFGAQVRSADVSASLSITADDIHIFTIEKSTTLDSSNIRAFSRVTLFDSAPYSLTFVLKTDRMPYQTHLEMTWDRTERVAFEGRLNLDSGVSGMAQLQIPVAGFETMSFTLNHQNVDSALQSNVELQYMTGQKIELNNEVDLVSGILSFSLSTPASYFRSLLINVRPESGTIAHESVLGVTAFEMTKTTTPTGKTYNMRLSSPSFEDVTLEISSHIEHDDYVHSMTLNLSPEERIVAEARMAVDKSPRFSFSVNTPFNALKHANFGLNHRGSRFNFNNNVDAIIVSNGFNGEFNSAIQVNGISTVAGRVAITGPVEFEMNLGHTFDGEALESSLEIVYGAEKLNVEVTGSSESGSFKITTPCEMMQEVNINVDLRGDDFAHSSNRLTAKLININGTSLFDTALDMNRLNRVRGNLLVSSPYMDIDRLQANLNHQIQDGISNTVWSVGFSDSQVYTVQTQMTFQSPSVTFTFTSPLSGYQRIYSSIALTEVESGRRLSVEYHCPAHGEFAADATLASTETGFNFEINTPTELMRNMRLSLDNTGTSTNFVSKASLEHNLIGKMTADATLSSEGSNINFATKIATPFQVLRSFNVELSNVAKSSDRHVSAFVANYNGANSLELHSDLSFRGLNDFNLRHAMTDTFSPIGGYTVDFSHQGTLMKGENHIQFSIATPDQYNLDTTWDFETDVECNLRFTSPLTEALVMSLHHAHSSSSSADRLEVRLGQQHSEWRSRVSIANPVEVSISAQSPYFRQVSVELRHEGDMLNFEHSSQITYDGVSQLGLTGSVSTNSAINAEFTLSSSCSHFNTATINLAHTGSLTSFDNGLKFSVDGSQYGYAGSFNLAEDRVTGNFQTSKPSGLFVGTEFDYTFGPSVSTMTKLKYDSLELVAELSFDHDAPYNVQFTLTPPAFLAQPFHVTIKHAGNLTKFENSIRGNMGAEKFAYSGSFQVTASELRGNFEAKTPFTGYESLVLNTEISYASDYSASVSGSYGSKQFAISSELTKHPLTARLTLDIPEDILPRTEVLFEINGLSVNGRVTVSEDVIYSLTGSMQLQPHFETHLQITTPHDILRSVESSITVTNNKVAILMTYNNAEVLRFDGDIKVGNHDLAIHVNTLGHDLTVTVGHEGALLDFQNEASVELDGTSLFAYTGRFAATDSIALNADVRTAVQAFSHFSVILNHEGVFNNFQNDLTIQLNRETIFSFEGQVASGEHGFDINFNIMGHPCEVKVTYSGNLVTSYDGTLEVKVDEVSMLSFIGSFTLEDHHVAIKMDTTTAYQPLSQMNMNVEYTGTMTNFKSKVKCGFNGQTVLDYSGSLRFENNGLETSLNANFNLMGHALDVSSTYSGDFVTSFDGTLVVKVDEVKMFSLTGSYHSEGQKVVITMETTTAYQPISQMSINVEYTGPISSFQNKVTIGFNGHTLLDYEGDMTINRNGIDINTSGMGHSFAMSAVHSGTPTDFTASFTVDLDKQNVIDFKIAFHLGDSITLTAAATTEKQLPITQVSIAVELEGPIKSSRLALEVQYNKQQVIDFTGSLGMTSNTLEGQVSVFGNTYEITATYTGQLTQFSTSLNVNIDTTSVVAFSTKFSLSDSMTLSSELTTAFMPVRHVAVNAAYNGPITNARASLNVQHNNQPFVDFTGSFSLNSNDVSVEISAMGHTFDASANHNGPLTNFQNGFTVRLDDATVAAYTGSFHLEGSQVTIEVTTSYQPISHVKVVASYDGPIMQSIHSLNVQLNRHTVVDYSGAMSFSATGVAAQVILFGHTYDISVVHTGSVINFKNSLKVLKDELSILAYDGTFSLENGMILNAEMTSAYQSVSHASVQSSFQQTESNVKVMFKVQVNNQDVVSYSGDLSLSSTGLTVNLNSIGHNAIVSLKHTGLLTNFENAFSLDVDNRKIVSYQGQFQYDRSMNLDVSLTTANPTFRQFSVRASHSGVATNFANSLNIDVNNKNLVTYTGDLTVDARGLHINTNAMGHSLKLNVEHSGSVASFGNRITIEFDGSSIFTSSLEFSQVEVQFEMATAVSKVSQFSLAVAHNGDASNFRNSLAITLNGEKIFNYAGEFSHGENGIHLDFEIITPYTQFSQLSITADHAGKSVNFNNNGKIIFNGNTIISTDNVMTISRSNAEVNLGMTSICDDIAQLSVVSAWTNKKLNLEIKHNDESILIIGSKVDLTAGLNAQVTIQSAKFYLDGLTMSVNHNGNLIQFTNEASLELNSVQLVTLTTEYDMTSRKHIAIELRTSYASVSQISMSSTYHNGQEDFVVKYKNLPVVSITGSIDLSNGFSGRFHLRTDSNIVSDLQAEFTHAGMLPECSTSTSLSLNGKSLITIANHINLKNGIIINTELHTASDIVSQLSSRVALSWETHDVELMYNSASVLVYTGRFNYANGIEGQVELTSMFAPLSHIAVRFSKSGIMANFDAATNIQYQNSQVFDTRVQFDLVEHKRLVIEMNTASSKLSQASVSVTFKSGNQEFIVKKNNEVLLTFNGEVQFQDTIRSTMTLSVAGRTATLTLSHRGGIADFESEAMLVLDEQRIVSISTAFDMINNYAASVDLRTGLRALDQFSVSLTCSGERQTTEIRYNHESMLSLTNEMTRGNGLRIQTQLETASHTLSNLNLVFHHNGGILRFNQEGTITINNKELMSMTSNVDVTDSYSVAFEIRTASQVVSHLSISLFHEGNLMQNSQNIELVFNDGLIAKVQTGFSLNSGLSAEFRLNTAVQVISELALAVEHTISGSGSLTSTHMELNGHQIYRISANVESTSPYSIHTELWTAYAPVSHVSLRMNLGGSLAESVHGLEFSLNGDRLVTYSGELGLSRNVRGAFNIETSHPAVESLGVRFNHKGHLARFNNNAALEHNGAVLMSVTSRFSGERGLSGGVTVDSVSDYLAGIELSFDHESRDDYLMLSATATKSGDSWSTELSFEGPIPNVQTAIKLTHNGENIVASSVALDFSKGFGIEHTITTAFSVVSELRTVAQFTGSLNNFQTNIDIQLNKAALVSSEFQFEMLAGRLSVQSPVLPVNHIVLSYNLNAGSKLISASVDGQDIDAQFSYSGPWNNMKTSFDVTHNTKNIFTFSSHLQLTGPYRLAFTSNSVALGEHSLEVEFEHSLGTHSYAGSLSVSYNNKNIIVTALDVDLMRMTASLTVVSEFNLINDIAATFSHQGTMNAFETDISFGQGRNTFNLNVHSDMINTKEVRVSFVTPFEGAREGSFVVNQQTLAEGLSTRFELAGIGSQTSFIEFSLQAESGLSGSVRLETPFEMARSIAVTASIQGLPTDMHAVLNFESNYFGNMNLEAALATESPIRLSLVATGDHIKDIAFEFRGHGSMQSLESSMRVTVHELIDFQTSASFHTSPRTEGRFQVRSTLPIHKDVAFSFYHEGSELQFSNGISMNINGQKIGQIDAVLSTSPSLMAQVELRSSIPNFEQMKIKITHSGPLDSFSGSAVVEYQSVVYVDTAIHMQVRPSVDGTITLASPFLPFKNIEVAFQHSGSLLKFHTSSSVTLNGERQGEASMEFDVTNGVNLALAIDSPLSPPISLSLRHQGDAMSFDNEIRVAVAERFVNAHAQLTISPSFSGIFTLETPFESIRNLNAEFTHHGQLENFESTIRLTHNDSPIGIHATFTTDPTIDGTLQVIAPFTNFPGLDLHVKHQGGLMNFISEAGVNIGTDETYLGKISFSLSQDVAGKIDLFLPEDRFSFGFNYEALDREHRASVIGNINGIESQLAVSVKPRPLEVTLHLTTPFTQVQDFAIRSSFRKGKKSAQGQIEISHNLQKMAKFEYDFTSYGQTQGSFRLTTSITHLEDVSASFTLNEDANGKSFETTLNFAPEHIIRSSVSVRNTPAFQFTLNTPYAGLENLHYEVSIQRTDIDFTIDSAFSWSSVDTFAIHATAAQEPNVHGLIRIRTPFTQEFSSRFSFEINDNVLDLESETSYGKDRFAYHLNLHAEPHVIGHLRVETPFPGLEVMEFGFHKKVLGIKEENQVSVSFTPNVWYRLTIANENGHESSLEINLQTPYEFIRDVTVFGAYQFNSDVIGYHVTLKDGEDIVIDNEFTLTLHPNFEISSSLTTPYTGLEHTTFMLRAANLNTSPSMMIDVVYNRGQHAYGSVIYARRPTGPKFELEVSSPCVYVRDLHIVAEYTLSDSTITPSFSLTHNQRSVASLSGEVTLPFHANLNMKTMFVGYETVTIEMSNEEVGNRYEPTLVISWGQKQVNIRGAMVKSGARHNTHVEGSVEINTPWNLLSEARLNVDRTSGRDARTTRVSGQYNQHKFIDVELQTNQNGGRRSSNLQLRSPAQFAGSISLEGTLDSFSLSLEGTVDGQAIRLDADRTNEPGQHTIMVRLTTPYRVMEVTSSLESSDIRMAHACSFSWDKNLGRTISHSLVVESHSSRYNRDFSVNTRLDLPIRSFEMSARHQKTASSLATSVLALWDASRDRSRMISINNRLEETTENYVHEIGFNYPGAEREITLRNELGINTAGKIFSGRSQLEYSSDPRKHLTLSASIQDSVVDGHNYTLQVGVRHPASQLDMEVTSSVADSSSLMSADVSMNYLTVSRQNKNMRLRAEIQKLRKRINMEMQSALKSYRLDGKLSDSDDHVSVRVVATEDNDRQVSASLDLNSVEHTLDMRAYMDPNNRDSMVHMLGKYGPSSVAFDAYHQDSNSHVSDAELDLEVRDRRLVYSKLFWRPQILSDLKAAVASRMAEIKNTVESTYTLASASVSEEVQARSEQIPEMPAASAAVAFISAEADSFKSDWEVAAQAFNAMYNSNEFYMKNIEAACNRVCDAIVPVLRRLAESITRSASAVYTTLIRAYEANIHLIVDSLEELRQVCIQVCQSVSEQYNAVAEYSQAKWAKAKEVAVEQAVVVSRNVVVALGPYAETIANVTRQYAEETYSYVLQHPYTITAVNAVSQVDIMAPLHDVHVSAKRNIFNMSETMAGHINTVLEKYSAVVETGREVSLSLMNEATSHPYVQLALTQVQDTATKVADLYNSLEFESESRQALEDFLTSSLEAMKTNALYLFDSYLQLDQNKIITWAPSEGLVEFQFYVPTDLPELQDVHINIPDFSLIYKLYKSKVMRLVPDLSNFSVWDYYYQYVQYLNSDKWLPPFDSYAMIAGRQHLMTFDGTYYDFSSPCSHVLAGDHVTGTWSLMTGASQDEEAAKSLVFVSGADKIVITPNYEVIINGEQHELPVEVSNAVILRQGNSLTITSSSGASVHCEMSHDVCRVHVPGWQFGRTGGLLGTFNNEPSDDMSAPNGQRMPSLSTFAASWALTPGCQASNLIPSAEARPTTQCSQLFDSNMSVFRPCYKVVDPAPFLQVCSNASRLGNDVCTASAMYVEACAQKNVMLNMPASCIDCESEIIDAANTADVVFVVEEGQCNADIITHLRQIAIKLETMALRSLGLKNSRYGLVGFGGTGSHAAAHSHTYGGQLFGTARTFRRTVTNFQISDEPTGDVYSAMQLAASYPFRSGASKTVIVVACEDASYNSPATADLMQEMGVSVHVLKAHEFQVAATDAPRTSRLFGVDTNTAFTSDHISDDQLVGDVTLHQQITVPSTGLAQISHSTSGVFFDVNQLTASRVQVQKRFIDVFVRRVAQSAVPASCQMCSCELSELTSVVSACRPCPNAWPIKQFPAVVSSVEPRAKVQEA